MDADLRDLLSAWLGGDDPGYERRDALVGRLRTDAAFRQAFVDEIHMLGMLKAVQSGEPRWLRLEDVIGWSAREPVGDAALAERVVRAGMARQRTRRLVRRFAAVAAAALACSLLLVAYVRFRTPEASRDEGAGPPIELARAVKVDGVNWEPGSIAPAEGDVVTTGRLTFGAGQLTLAFFGGVALTAEGPADLELLDRDRIFCHRGKLRVRVSPGAEGFTVAAPGYEIIDLGTEFGLNMEVDGKGRIMVFEGEAAVSLLGDGGRSRQGALVAGAAAVEVDPSGSGIREVPPTPDRFVRLPESPLPVLEFSSTYGGEILAAEPTGYWRFQRIDGGLVPNEVAGRPPLRAVGGVRLDGDRPNGNRWAYFPQGDVTQALVMEGEWMHSRANGYAIEVWVQPSQLGLNLPGSTALVSAIARTDGPEEKHVSLLELIARGRRSVHEPCAVRFLDRWPAARIGGADAFSRRSFVPSQWHHVVGQKSGDILQLYVDGELVGTSPARLNFADPDGAAPCRVLVGRLKQLSIPPHYTEIRPFEGRLDELAIYDRPLTVAEIRRHVALRAANGVSVP
jgi:Concanavalin A-like lectin/glucanases superfamily